MKPLWYYKERLSSTDIDLLVYLAQFEQHGQSEGRTLLPREEVSAIRLEELGLAESNPTARAVYRATWLGVQVAAELQK